MVVDDEVSIRQLVSIVLERQGYSVIQAEDGAEALDILKAEPDDAIQLIVTDVMMPRMNGVELVKRSRNLRPRVKTIFMSGYTDVTSLTEDGDSPPFMHKPMRPDTILSIVRQTLGTDAGRSSA
ncbi:MAG: response regulator [Acidobacteriota bacterium]